MRPRSLAVLVIPIVLTASAAEAKSSFTPPADADPGINASCVVQNLGTKSRSVGVVLHDGDGLALVSTTTEVMPGRVSQPLGASGQGAVYCEFDGLNRSVRGFLELKEGATTLLVLPAGK